jgi:hypothetical protein
MTCSLTLTLMVIINEMLELGICSLCKERASALCVSLCIGSQRVKM